MRKRLNVPATDISLASVACSKALNLPAARALSRRRGAMVAIDALHGRTVKLLFPEGPLLRFKASLPSLPLHPSSHPLLASMGRCPPYTLQR